MSTLGTAIRAAGSSAKIDGDSFTKEFVFDADFIGFDGHFPGNPILPAMVQLMLGEVSAVEAAGQHLVCTDAARAKFVRQVVPGETVLVSGTLSLRNGLTKATVTLTVNGETASTYVLTLAAPEQS